MKREGTKFNSKATRKLIEDDLKWKVNSTISDVLDDINSGINDKLKETLERLNLQRVINTAIRESLVTEVMNDLSPYYRDEFYSTLSGTKIKISPFWDTVWQEIELEELVKGEIEWMDEVEDITKLKDAFHHCYNLINEKQKELEQKEKK